jgi:PTH1 family peptidyl-tRNA hydrolase
MKCLIGLGNPGKEYERTRHNVGFMVIDALAKQFGVDVARQKFHSLYGEGHIAGERFLLVKPQTYMNQSGQCVREVLDWYKLDTNDLLIIYDDMDLETGRVRLRAKGSAGGHNGIKSVIADLGTEALPRLKIGIGRPRPGEDAVAHVLSPFTREEWIRVEDAIRKAVRLIEIILHDGFDKAVSQLPHV